MKQISIIGLSRAGKTCYMYAMAKTMRRGINGVTIFTPNDILRDQLDLGWRKIRREHKWPSGSDKVVHCDFQCMLNLRNVMDFCWDDFKGGILNSFSEIDTKFKYEFYSYLEKSDGLIFFIAADMIERILTNSVEAEDEIDDLEKLNEIIAKLGGKMKQIPITIAITKSDLLNKKAKQLLFPIIKNIFPSLFDVNNNIKTLIVPVSLGQNLGNGNQEQEVSGIVFADPKEGNIHIPILFNLYYYLKDYIKDTRGELDSLKNRLNKNSSSINIANSHNALTRWWKDENLDDLNNNKQEILNKIKETEKVLSDYECDLKKVRDEFTKDCQYYDNGKLQTL